MISKKKKKKNPLKRNFVLKNNKNHEKKSIRSGIQNVKKTFVKFFFRESTTSRKRKIEKIDENFILRKQEKKEIYVWQRKLNIL